MKTLYFDCFSGISGDMTLGALLDIGEVTTQELSEELSKLGIDAEFYVHADKVQKNGITGTYANVHVHDEHTHHHHDEHEHGEHTHSHGRSMADIVELIGNSNISEVAKTLSRIIFEKIASAEAKVHNQPVSDVHFHEVGAVDSIIDIVGTAILIDKMGIQKVVAGPVSDGYGFANCQHGMIPVPVPAVCEMFAKNAVPTRRADIESELVTPTGAGIICGLVSQFSDSPNLSNSKVGYGAGKKEFKTPNLLRIYVGETAENADDMIVVETNIDDMTGEKLAYAMEKLFESGAADVAFVPMYMKKNRPATLIKVVCAAKIRKDIEDVLFTHTSTIGVRYYSVGRTVLTRSKHIVSTKYGEVGIKACEYNGKTKYSAEYEDLSDLASMHNVSIEEIEKAAFEAIK